MKTPTMYGNIPVYAKITVEGREVFSVAYPLSGEYKKPNCLMWHDEEGKPFYSFILDVNFVEQYALEYVA